jgi:hypothetical protein
MKTTKHLTDEEGAEIFVRGVVWAMRKLNPSAAAAVADYIEGKARKLARQKLEAKKSKKVGR